MKQSYIKNLEQILQQNFPWHKSRIKFLSLILLAILKASTVNLSRVAVLFHNDTKISSNYKRIQRFLRYFNFSYTLFASLIISLLPKGLKYIITLDRTNWKFGKSDINILMLAVIYKEMSIPLFWEILPKQGNSSSEERIEITSRALKLLGKENITSIVADREFVGIKWFLYLNQTGITYRMRIKSNTCIDSHKSKGKRVDKLFRPLKLYKPIVIPKQVIIFKQTVYITGMRIENDYLILATNERPFEAIEDYKKRWTIEKLFKHFKTGGFNFGLTHLRDAEKIKKLIALVALAFIWSFLVGVWMDSITPIKLKKHGRMAVSYFNSGFGYINHLIENIQLEHKFKEFNLMLNFLSCT